MLQQTMMLPLVRLSSAVAVTKGALLTHLLHLSNRAVPHTLAGTIQRAEVSSHIHTLLNGLLQLWRGLQETSTHASTPHTTASTLLSATGMSAADRAKGFGIAQPNCCSFLVPYVLPLDCCCRQDLVDLTTSRHRQCTSQLMMGLGQPGPDFARQTPITSDVLGFQRSNCDRQADECT